MAVPISILNSYRLFKVDNLIKAIIEDEAPFHAKFKEAELLVSKLPNRVAQLTKYKDSNSSVTAETCSICMECLGIGSSSTTVVDKELKCSHVFHNRCLVEWLARDRTCPLCRTSVAV